jgi:hypothetical protein
METRPESYPMSITELMELESEYSIKAYILIKADPREIPSIMLALSTFEGVRTADVVTGPYDIIVFVEVKKSGRAGKVSYKQDPLLGGSEGGPHLRSGENMNYPKVVEEEDRIIVIYSEEPHHYVEEDDGVLIYYSKLWEVVKIVIKKDEKHHIIKL